ncbi:MAG: glycerol-3-phosphate dehydrogenase [Clostridia bacterium]|nr:glycerol-3-phosphate dehydrogenase [Clostridia bacterium]
MANITIVGAGMMGSALAFPALENGHSVRLVGTPLDADVIEHCRLHGRHPKFDTAFPDGRISCHQVSDLALALKGADLVIGGVSSFGVDWFSQEVLPLLAEGTPVLTVTKGLMDMPDGTLKPYPFLWEEKLRQLGKYCPLNAVGGPCTSYELVSHDQTHVAFCGRDIQVLEKIKEWMQTPYYHVSLSTDVMGIESAVALKNGYALAVALTIGVNQRQFGEDSPLHFNSQAAVFGQSVVEMERLLKWLGAYSLHNLSVGIGDLYVTVYGGRTRQIGILLGKGLDIDEARRRLDGVTLESLVVAVRVARALRAAAQRGLVREEDYPLLLHADEILTEKVPVNIPWERFTFREEV